MWIDHPEIPQAMLYWEKGVLKEMIVSEVNKENEETETILFKMSPMEGYEDRSFGKPAIVGSMPGGFRITEGGSISKWTTGVTYRVKVIGEIGEKKFWSTVDFIGQGE